MNRTVLIVDDEPGIRAALLAHFTREGWQAAAASGVREAEYRLAQTSFDLVVSDVRLPDGSGASLLRAAHGIPVILLTAFGSVTEAVGAIRAGARDYLTKPVSWPHLREAAERFAAPPQAPTPMQGTADAFHLGEALRLGEIERLHLERTLALALGNRTRAAEMLGISVRTIRNKIREYGLPPRTYNGTSTTGANA